MFTLVSSFSGPNGANTIFNPTSLQFGPDGRLYVSQQNGVIRAYTVEKQQDGTWEATAEETLQLPGGAAVVRTIANHDDNGTFLPNVLDRQVTGIVTAGTAENPVLYVTSSDPRISENVDVNLDTNSGVLTKVTWNGSAWEAVDLIRGLPRSEENHANNGMVIDPATGLMYMAVGGNTNNGAPSQLFAYTAEYALSATILEIDLPALEAMPVLTDPLGGRTGPRDYVYDLPTLDDPNIPNDGVREDANGLDVQGPWGGNDGLNQAILPADAPLRIYADGLRNNYDLALTADGQLYTVDNGSNPGIGGDPVIVDGEATNTPVNDGEGAGEPLFLIEDGGYYGHPNPTRSNQDQSWTVYDDNGVADTNVGTNFVADISALVPDSLQIQEGFLIDPSKFTGDPDRLAQSGVRVRYTEEDSPALAVIGTSSNGLIQYTGPGELNGDLLVVQFNGNVGRLVVSEDGTSATYEPVEGLSGLSLGLDLTNGPDGSVWVAELGGNGIKVFAPGDAGSNDDIDNDGLNNTVDPFQRDALNGTEAVLNPGEALVWDFDPDQDGNLQGPAGFGGGLTGVMVNGLIDYEDFFAEPSTREFQNVNLDNVKFVTAAGGGTIVVEFVSNGSPEAAANDAEYVFHTGMTIDENVEAFDVEWTVINPSSAWTADTSQQIGGYLGSGDQDNYFKVAATAENGGSFQVVLENAGTIVYDTSFDAPGLLTGRTIDSIFMTMRVDKIAETITPTVRYELPDGSETTLVLDPVSVAGTNVLDTILGNTTVNGTPTGLAAGLISSNEGANVADAFQAVFTDLTVTDATPGAALLQIMPNNNGIQTSNFISDSFMITNVGGKEIVSVSIDVSTALYGDAVFDPEGLAGDTTSKPLTIDTPGGTGVVDPLSYNPYIGPGGIDGYRTLVLNFDSGTDGGFEFGEKLGFSIDMDPNSVAGAQKGPLDAGSDPAWDVGGISGAELIGSTFTVTFADGETATGSLIGTNTQAGSQGIAQEGAVDLQATLTVNGLGAGGAGEYTDPPQVLVDGPTGETVRIVLSKGFIQPTNNLFFDGDATQQAYAPQLQAQLDALAASDFPANNAVEFQTVDVVLGNDPIDVSNLFNFTEVADFDFAGEDSLPLAFAAAIIDPANDNLPKGAVTAPIYLKPSTDAGFTVDDTFNVIEDGQDIRLAVLANDDGGEDLTIVSVDDSANGTTSIVNGEIIYNPDADYAGPDSFTYTAEDSTGAQSTATVTLDVQASHEQPQSTIDDRIAPELSPSGVELVISRYVELPFSRVNSFDTFGDRIFVSIEGATSHDGKVYEIVRSPDGSVTSELFFDVGAAFAAAGIEQTTEFGGQGQLRSIAFHPDFENNGKFYVSAVIDRPTDTTGLTYISDFTEVTDTDSVIVEFTADPITGALQQDSYREVGRIALPQNANHPVKQIEFNQHAQPGDEDYGLLYISVGDGVGNGLNVIRNASQNNDALGKMLRIDPLEQTDGSTYGIPSTNPFVGDPDMLDEVYALGLRNEHTFSFYKAPDDTVYLIATGVGYDNIDEVNIIEAGDNLGWGLREGPFVAGGPSGNGLGNTTGLEALPADEWQNGYRYPATFVAHDAEIGNQGDVGQALSGGFVVTNGSELDGQFIFGDFSQSSRLYHVPIEDLLAAKTSLDENESPELLSWATPSELTLYENVDFDTSTTPEIRSSFAEIVGNFRSDLRFGEGPEGQIFLTNKHDGWVYIVENSVAGGYTPPTNLAPTTEIADSLIYNGHAYVVEGTGQTWEDAQATATALGGTLVTIQDALENAAITSAFVLDNPVWLGLNDKDTEGTFVDINGVPASYFNWLPGEPNNAAMGDGQDYALIGSNDGRWDDGVNFGGIFFDGTSFVSGRQNITVVEYDFLIQAQDDDFAIDVGQTAEAIAFGSAQGLLANDRFFRDEPVIVFANGQALTDQGGGIPEITLAGSNGGTFTITAEGGMVFDGGTDFDGLAFGETAVTSVTYTAEEISGETSTASINVTVTGIGSGTDIRFGDSSYLLGTPGLTWSEAKAEAEALGGILLEVNSAEENQFIVDTFLDGNPIWLGFNDIDNEGTFVGADGQPITYTNWINGAPDNGGGGQDVVAIASAGGRWDDAKETFGWFFDGSWSSGFVNQTVIEFVDGSGPIDPEFTLVADTIEADVGDVGSANILDNDVGVGLTVIQVGASTTLQPGGNFWVPGDNGGNFWVSPNGNVFFYQGSAFDGLNPGESATSSVTYVVSNSNGDTATSTITAEITAPGGGNQAPEITSLAAFTVDENTTDVATVVATDPEGSDVIYSISGGADAALFEIDADTGALSFVTAPDFETPTDSGADGVYDVQVSASDGSLSSTQDIAVTVADVNEAPTAVEVTNATTDLDENTDTTVRIKLADIAVTDDLLGTNGLSLAGADSALFEIDGTELFLSAGVTLDHETAATLDVQIQVDDADVGGMPDAVADFTLTVNDVNEAPEPSDPGDQTLELGEVAVLPTLDSLFSDPDADDVVTYEVDMLPDGITLAPDGVTLQGTPTTEGTTTVTVTATDLGGLQATQSFDIVVEDTGGGNQAPEITSLAAFTVDENTTDVATVVATDPEGSDVIYSISGGADAALFEIDADTGALSFVTAPDFETPTDSGADGVYDVQVSASDGSLSSTQDIAVTVADVNEAPTAVEVTNATTDLDENTDTTVRIKLADIAVTDDLLGTNGLSLAGADSALFEIDGTELFLSAGVTLDHETAATLDVQIQVDDADVGGMPDAVADFTLTVNDVNEAPEPSDPGDQTLELGEVAVLPTLDSLFSDPDADDVVTYEVDMLPDGITLAPDGVTLQGTPTTEGTTTVTVTATDLGGLQATQSFDIVVEDTGGGNQAPEITSLAAFTVDENTTDVATVVATDPEGSDVIYSISGGADAALFEIDADTGALSFVTAPDFETPTDSGADGVYDVQVSASDGSLSSTQDIAVTVADVNEAPTAVEVTNATTDLDENTDTTVRIKLADIAVTDDLLGTNGLSLAGADSALFEIDGTELFLSAGVTLDHETAATLDVQIQVDDADVGGMPDAVADFTLTVNDVNEAPEPSDPGDQTLELGEVAVLPTLDSLFSDPDADDVVTYEVDMLPDGITLAPDGVTLQGTPTTEGTTTVTVTATDLGGLQATQSFDVVVEDTGGFNASPDTIEVEVGAVGNLNVLANDTGEGLSIIQVGNQTTLQPGGNFWVPGDNGGNFWINPDNGNTFFYQGSAFNNLNPGQTVTSSVTYVVSNSGGETSTSTITVEITAPGGGSGGAPTITTPDAFTVDENTSAVTTVAATDPENDNIFYTISGGADETLFAIDADTGALSFVTEPDFEAPADSGGDNVYDVQVSASDGNLSTTQDITVTVNDVNEAPEPSDPGDQTLELGEVAVLPTLDSLFSDPDADDVVTYEVDTLPDGITLAPDGVTLQGTPTTEGTTTVTVTATDLGGLQATQSFDVVVEDTSVPSEGYFEMIRAFELSRFKIQIEDPRANNGGTNPPGNWTYVEGDGADGNQPNTQGTGHYYWGSEASSTQLNPPQENSILSYNILIPEGEGGEWTVRVVGSRDTNEPEDARNDAWLRVNGDSEAFQVSPTKAVAENGFVKVFGGGTGIWGTYTGVDSANPNELNFPATFNLGEGLHTIEIAGRSQGFHIDFIDVWKEREPWILAPDSPFVSGDSNAAQSSALVLDTELSQAVASDIVNQIDDSADDWSSVLGATGNSVELGSNGGDQWSALRFDDITIPDGAVIQEAFIRFTADETSSEAANFTIAIEDTENSAVYANDSLPIDRTYLADEFVWNNLEGWQADQTYDTGDISSLITAVIGEDGVSGGSLGFLIEGTGTRSAVSFDSETESPAELHIIFDDNVV